MACIQQDKEKVDFIYIIPVAQWLEHCVSNAKVVGLIPREHMY